MKNLVYSCFLAAVVILYTAWLAYPAFALLDPGSIVAVWLVDEGEGDMASDTSGNGHEGDILGDVVWVDGKFGKALEFPGDGGSFVEIPHDDSLTLVEWTITAWAKLNSPPGGDWAVIVVKAVGNGTQNYSLDMDGGGRVLAEVTSGGGWSDCGSVTTIYDDAWHFLVASYDGATLRIYVDGEQEKEQNFAAGDVSVAPVTLGARTGDSQPVLGIVDDIGLFNVALDDAELDNIENDGLSNALGLAAVEPGSKLTTSWGEIKKR